MLIPLIVILIGIAIALPMRTYKISDLPFYNDERFELETAMGYLKTGEFVRWDFQNDEMMNIDDPSYTLPKAYVWQIAQVFEKMTANEFSGRLVSIIWGTLTVAVFITFTFLITKNIPLTVASAITAAWNPLLIWSSTTLRLASFQGDARPA